nr:oligoribonuclease [Dietzia timorensis]
MNPKHDRIVWIDCEMTGLDGGTEPGADLLVEIAALVTDSELNVLGDGVDIVIGAPDEALDSMNDVVQEMHRSSGLTEEIRASKVTVEEAEKAVLDYVRQHVSQPGTAPLAGNSIATDRKFISRDMPELDEYLHYRMIDVSSIKELCRRWYPRIYFGQPDKGMAHRALADIIESIKELRYYRATAFVPQPGPTSEDVAAAAKKITEG